MFTGIVETTAEILERSATGLVLVRPRIFDDVKVGASISVSGACLTITKVDQTSLHFDVVKETWDRTKLGSLHAGDRVNLERALAANGRFEGHVVQGHVEGVGRVASFIQSAGGEDWYSVLLAVELPPELLPFVVFKGSITLDGVALTVAKLEQQMCTIALIPHTLAVTTLGTIKEGDMLNVETDVLGRYVAAMLNRSSPAPHEA